MKNAIAIGLCLFLALIFVVSGIMHWKYQGMVQDDVNYMSKQMMDAPEKMPWSRNEGSFPYGIHEEMGLHSSVASYFSAINQLSAAFLIVILSYMFFSGYKRSRVEQPSTKI
jgi:uncharacterized membrane protein YphA (DoxX/SURF4 family)